MRRRFLECCVCGSAALLMVCLVGCRPERPSVVKYRIGEQGLAEQEAANRESLESVVVGGIGDESVTAGDLEALIKGMPVPEKYYYSSPERVTLLFKSYALSSIMAWLNSLSGKGISPRVQAEYEDALALEYQRDYLSRVVKVSEITEDDVDAWLAARDEEVRAVLGENAGDSERRTYAMAQVVKERRELAWKKRLEELRAEVGLDLDF